MSIESLKARLPDYAKDLKLNLGSLAFEPSLTAQQRAGTFIASALATRNAELVRAITASQAYQRTSAADDPSQADPRRFARMPVKGMSPEQLFDSLALATGYRDPVPGAQRPLFGLPADSPRGAFLAKFVGGDQRTDMQTSILQALTLMNGEFIGRLTDPEKGEMLAAVAAAPFLNDADRIDALYLATLSRLPRPDERRRALRLVETGDPKKGLSDVFWALLNSPEFLLNH